MKEGITAKVEINTKAILDRQTTFINNVKKLCDKYNVEMQLAKNDETKDNYIVINVKDLIREKDIKISMQEGET